MKYSVYVGEEELTDYTIIPISEQLALDESLDQGYLQLKFTNKQNAYKPFTEVRIVINDEFIHERELNFFIASDNKTEIIANGTFSHDLLLIEQSKWFERFLTGTKTVTNPLVHDYAGAAGDVYIKYIRTIYTTNNSVGLGMGVSIGNNAYTNTTYFYSNKYQSVINLQSTTSLNCVSANDMFDYTPSVMQSVSGYLEVTKNGNTTRYSYNQSPTLDLSSEDLGEGDYKFYYKLQIVGGLGATISEEDREYEFHIYVISQAEPKPNKTITDAVNSLLATIETLRASETPRFVLDSEQATKYSAIDSPEFTLTGTLWEALRQIGTYIHAIPRLRGNIVYFDELGGDEKVANKLTDYISNTEQFDIEQFASGIDSTIQNIVNIEDDGAIIEPYKVGYRTPRTEESVVVLTQENMFIKTDFPIEKIIKVEIGYLTDESIVGDITPYVYEQAEYDALSSYENNYPYSKAFAIKYVVGRNNITELNFKQDHPINPIFSNYSIKNIISRVTGKSISVIDQLFGDGIGDIRSLQFRVTYIPITTARAKQVKPYTEDLMFDSILAYNQSAQKISSKAYGEAMKGAIARLGNPQVTKVFILNDLSLIPNPGQLYDDEYYVSVVKCEYYRDFVKCSVGLSKNFNRLNEYVGINSEQRFYEISEKQAEDRYVLYEDYCVLGKRENIIYNGKSLINNYYDFRSGDTQVRAVQVTGDDNVEVRLPVISYYLGNSMIFTFNYSDNYSAGNYVYLANTGASLNTTVQNQIRYTDDYGEIQYLHIDFGDVKLNSRVILDPSLETYDMAIQKGNKLPLIPDTTIEIYNPITQQTVEVPDEIFSVVMTTGDDDIRLEKDNREKITFTYQMHFVSTDKNIVIGNIAKYNSLFTQGGGQYQNDLYILQNKIGKFDKFIDTTTATRVDPGLVYYTSVTQNSESIGFGFALRSVPISGKAWAVVKNGELVFGSNEDIEASNSEKELTTFVFTRKVN